MKESNRNYHLLTPCLLVKALKPIRVIRNKRGK
jgi:hypothetical protein